MHRECLAITGPTPNTGSTTLAWDWASLRSRCVREATRVLPRVDAEEAVQEALVRAWLRRDACRSPEAPLPWVLEITRNETRRLLGRRALRSTREVHPEGLDPNGEDDDLAGAATRMTVEQALDAMPVTDQRLLRLRYGEDLTQVEVARHLGLPEGTVKVRLHRARRRLRDLLEDAR